MFDLHWMFLHELLNERIFRENCYCSNRFAWDFHRPKRRNYIRLFQIQKYYIFFRSCEFFRSNIAHQFLCLLSKEWDPNCSSWIRQFCLNSNFFYFRDVHCSTRTYTKHINPTTFSEIFFASITTIKTRW
jgi:hypothetical protein